MLQKVSPNNSLDTPRPEVMVASYIAVGSQKMEDLRKNWTTRLWQPMKTLNAYTNVECCNSVKSFKYVNRLSDAASFSLQIEDRRVEVTHYQVSRYISSNEAFWHISGFPFNQSYPTNIANGCSSGKWTKVLLHRGCCSSAGAKHTLHSLPFSSCTKRTT